MATINDFYNWLDEGKEILHSILEEYDIDVDEELDEEYLNELGKHQIRSVHDKRGGISTITCNQEKGEAGWERVNGVCKPQDPTEKKNRRLGARSGVRARKPQMARIGKKIHRSSVIRRKKGYNKPKR